MQVFAVIFLKKTGRSRTYPRRDMISIVRMTSLLLFSFNKSAPHLCGNSNTL
jgi:hypothetical protein